MMYYVKKFYNFVMSKTLAYVVKKGSIRKISFLLKLGVNIDTIVKDDKTALELACEKEDINMVDFLLSKGANLSAYCDLDDKKYYKTLGIALSKNNKQMFEHLLKHVKETSNISYKLLFTALQNKDKSIAIMLIKSGINVNDKSGFYEFKTPLEKAQEEGNLDLIKALLEGGADVNKRSHFGTPLEKACLEGNIELVKLLISHNANINSGYSLIYACRNNNLELVKYLVNNGANVNLDDLFGTPLTEAIGCNNVEMVKCLIERGADVNLYLDSYSAKIPLIFAIKKGNMEIIKCLIQAGADVNLIEKTDKKAPLSYAIKKDSSEVAKLLIERGADISIDDDNGRLLLTKAIEWEDDEIVKLAIEKGANINIDSDNGRLLLFYAIKRENDEIVKLLIEKGTDISILKDNGNLLLTKAIIWGNEELVKLLVEEGADISILGDNGSLLLTKAIEWGNDEIVKLSIEKGADVNLLDNLDNNTISPCIPMVDAKQKEATNLEVNLNDVINSIKIEVEPKNVSRYLNEIVKDIENFDKATEQNMKLIHDISEKIKHILENGVMRNIKEEIKNDKEAIKKLPDNTSDSNIKRKRDTIIARLELNKQIVSVVKNAYSFTEKIVETIVNAMYFPKNLKRIREESIKKEKINNIKSKDNINIKIQ